MDEWNKVERINKYEILIQHKLFDIKSIQKNDNGIVITGHFDTKEDQLQKTANQLDKKSELNKHSLPFFSFLFFELIYSTKEEKTTTFYYSCQHFHSSIYSFMLI